MEYLQRELRILLELKKKNCPYCPIVLDSGRVGDLPFIGRHLYHLCMNLREQTVVEMSFGFIVHSPRLIREVSPRGIVFERMYLVTAFSTIAR